MMTQITKSIPVVLFALFVMACGKSVSAPPQVKIEIIDIVRPRALRCGPTTIDNLCINDIVYMKVVSAKMLLVYRYDTIRHRDDGLVFSCPNLDPRCIQFSDGFLVNYQLTGQARFEVVALPDLATEVGDFDQVHRDHLGKYERIVLEVRHL